MIKLFGDWYLSADIHSYELKQWDGITIRENKNGTNSPVFSNTLYFSELSNAIKKVFNIALREKIGEGFEVQSMKDLKQMIEDSVNLVNETAENITPELPER